MEDIFNEEHREKNIKHIGNKRRLEMINKDTVTEKFSATASDGKNYLT